MSRGRRSRVASVVSGVSRTGALAALLIALLHVAAAQTVHYQAIENHFKLPDGRKIGSSAGMFVRPHGIHVDRDGNIWVADGEGPDGKDARRDGKVTAVIPDPDPEKSQEGVAADSTGNIYGSLTAGMALKKYVPAAGTAN